MSFAVPKFAVALLIMQLMPPWKHGKWFLYFITISLLCFSAPDCIFVFVQCSPPNSLWDPSVPSQCWPFSVVFYYSAFVGCKPQHPAPVLSSAEGFAEYSAFYDLGLAAFPITFLWNLQIHLMKKIGICCLMGLGTM